MRGVLLAFTAIALAQEPIRVTTRLIETNVVVRDAHGPVGDLTRDSFTLLEDGQRRRIAVFRVSKVSATKPRLLPAGVFSNRLLSDQSTESTRQVRYKVILIDQLNTRLADQIYAKGQLQKSLARADVVNPTAVCVMGERFSMLQVFTTDKTRLLAGVAAFRPMPTRILLGQDLPPINIIGQPAKMAQDTKENAGEFFNRVRADMSMRVFEELAKALARAPGRKSIVWISDGFPLLHLLEQDTRRWKMLGDVAIYPVYAHGLGLLGPGIDAESWIAQETAGRSFYNRNDIGQAVQEALRDDDVTYTLGFYPEREKPDGNYHQIKVTVDRKGASARHRPGYVDREAAAANPDPATLARQIASEDFDATEVGLAASVQRGGANLRIAVAVDMKDLRLVMEGERWKGSVILASVSRAANGDRVDSSDNTVALDMSDAEYQLRLKNGLTLSITMPAVPGLARIRVAIVDQSGAAGSVLVIPK